MADPQLFYVSKQFANFPSLQSVEVSEAEIVQLVASLREESEWIVRDVGHDAQLVILSKPTSDAVMQRSATSRASWNSVMTTAEALLAVLLNEARAVSNGFGPMPACKVHTLKDLSDCTMQSETPRHTRCSVSCAMFQGWSSAYWVEG